jgi:PKD repeat protein
MKKILSIILLLLVYNANAQVKIITSNPSGSCSDLAVSFDITSRIVGTGFDFNTGTLPPGWNSSPYRVVNDFCRDPYGFSKTRTPYFWATTLHYDGWHGYRFVQTNWLNVKLGGIIKFDMRYARDDPQWKYGGNGCEDPDLASEGVFLQYKIDGQPWKDIATWVPISGYGKRPGEKYLYQWETYQYAIPAAAQTPKTRFRWYQPRNSGDMWDNWGLDDIQISIFKNVVSAKWKFGDGTTSTQLAPTHKYIAPGTYKVELEAIDSDGDTHYVTIDYTILPNQAPSLDFIPDVYIDEDSPEKCINLSGIDDGDVCINQNLTVTATASSADIITTPTVTYTSPDATGTICFTPKPDKNGVTTITVRVTDDNSFSGGGVPFVERTFKVHVNPINDFPIADNLDVNIDKNETYFLNPTNLKYFDLEGDALKGLIIKKLPAKGVLKYYSTPMELNRLYTDYTKISYTPALDEIGMNYSDIKFKVVDLPGGISKKQYKITIHVHQTNSAPVAKNDNKIIYVNDNLNGYNVLNNDVDDDGDAIVLFDFVAPKNGTATIQNNGVLNYSPNVNFVGLDTIIYRASDGTDISNNGLVIVDVDTARWNGFDVFTNVANWNADYLPDGNNDIIVETGHMVVSNDTEVKSLFLRKNANVTADSFSDFTINGFFNNYGGVMKAEEDSNINIDGNLIRVKELRGTNSSKIRIKKQITF